MYFYKGLHPRVIADGYDLAKKKALEFLDKFRVQYDGEIDRNLLVNVARTALRTKVHHKIADHLADICIEAVLSIRKPNEPIDLFMVEIMEMQHKTVDDTTLVKGLVLDHGARHPDMKKHVRNAYILICNVSLEYEKT